MDLERGVARGPLARVVVGEAKDRLVVIGAFEQSPHAVVHAAGLRVEPLAHGLRVEALFAAQRLRPRDAHLHRAGRGDRVVALEQAREEELGEVRELRCLLAVVRDDVLEQPIDVVLGSHRSNALLERYRLTRRRVVEERLPCRTFERTERVERFVDPAVDDRSEPVDGRVRGVSRLLLDDGEHLADVIAVGHLVRVHERVAHVSRPRLSGCGAGSHERGDVRFREPRIGRGSRHEAASKDEDQKHRR